MPRCKCTHAGDRHAERPTPGEPDESEFFCLDCKCRDYEPELVEKPN